MNRISNGPTKFTLETEYNDKTVTITGEAATVSFEQKNDYEDVRSWQDDWVLTSNLASSKTDVTMEVVQPYTVTIKEKQPAPVVYKVVPVPPLEVVLWKK